MVTNPVPLNSYLYDGSMLLWLVVSTLPVPAVSFCFEVGEHEFQRLVSHDPSIWLEFSSSIVLMSPNPKGTVLFKAEPLSGLFSSPSLDNPPLLPSHNRLRVSMISTSTLILTCFTIRILWSTGEIGQTARFAVYPHSYDL